MLDHKYCSVFETIEVTNSINYLLRSRCLPIPVGTPLFFSLLGPIPKTLVQFIATKISPFLITASLLIQLLIFLGKMKIIRTVFRSGAGLCHRFHQPQSLRTFATSLNLADDDKLSTDLFGTENDKQSTNVSESEADFAQRIFSDSGDSLKSSSFFRQRDRLRNNNDGGFGLGSRPNNGGRTGIFDDLDISFTSLSDGVDTKLMKAARYFEYDSEEVEKDDYAFRPDVTFRTDDTYEPKDLDLTKPGIQKPFKRQSEFETTTEEVLRKADFRNVRFLANFITEAGILIKRSQTGISAKAQRKVAREIKTARAFGLMPFTTMGSKQFVYGRTMESLSADYEYEASIDATSFVEDG